MKRAWLAGLMCVSAVAAAAEISMEGLPLQVEWQDLNNDGQLDLVALMLVSQTEGAVETFFENGKLRGVYEDQTFKEKYLIAFLREGDGWRKTERLDLGREATLGFALEPGPSPTLMLWTAGALVAHRWDGSAWKPAQRVATPGMLAGESVYLNEFPFWQRAKDGPRWIVPDLEGMRVVDLSQPSAAPFVAYPQLALRTDREAEDSHQLMMAMPRFLDVDGDAAPELIFTGDGRVAAWTLDSSPRAYYGDAQGYLIDLNNDGMVDLIQSEMEGDIDRRKDLPKVKSRVTAYLATAPLTFPEEPDINQVVSGFVLQSDMEEIELPNPFLDLNSDGLPDLAGMAFKVSFFQLLKVATTGRLTLRFLLHLYTQKADGGYRALAGGPFQMVWKINIRKLRMPTFAQMTADFDGDGWIDIMMEKESKLIITPLGDSGFGVDRQWRRAIPKSFRDPDQVYGKDVDGDGAAEFVLMKISGARTRVGVLER